MFSIEFIKNRKKLLAEPWDSNINGKFSTFENISAAAVDQLVINFIGSLGSLGPARLFKDNLAEFETNLSKTSALQQVYLFSIFE